MILAVDVGNTNIVFGGIEKSRTRFFTRLNTDRNKTEDEYAVIFKTLIEINRCNTADFSGAIISSVVPGLNEILSKALRQLVGKEPLIVGPGIKTGLDIKIDNPATLGSDLVVGAVAATACYKKPLIIIDMGTATTVGAVDKDGVYRGGVIIPGVRVAMESLTNRAAQLQDISLEAPGKTIGTNTADCLRSGIVYGNACMLDGIIDRISSEMEGTPTVVATGGLSPKIIPHCTHKITIDNDLLIKGLEIIYNKNNTASHRDHSGDA